MFAHHDSTMTEILLNHRRQTLNCFGISGKRNDREPIGKTDLLPATDANRHQSAAVRHEWRAFFETPRAPVNMARQIRSRLFDLLGIHVGIFAFEFRSI